MGDFSNTYSYNPGAYGTLEPNLIEGIKGLNYITGGIRAAAFGKKFEEQNGHIYTDAWGGPPFYDALWIVATAINLANSLDRKKIRDAMFPAAYHYFGVSGNGDKGFNKWGMQASDQYREARLQGRQDGAALGRAATISWSSATPTTRARRCNSRRARRSSSSSSRTTSPDR